MNISITEKREKDLVETLKPSVIIKFKDTKVITKWFLRRTPLPMMNAMTEI